MRITTSGMRILILSLFLISSGGIFAQSVNVSGTVSDQDGVSLPGANITIKGSTTGVITDIDGNYTISAQRGDILVFSFIGYMSEEVEVGNLTELSVQLSPSVESLDEVVVVGYGQQEKVSITGAISSVQSEELLRSPSASITNSLSGKVSGVTSVQYSGEPGADQAEIYVRGVASLTTERSQPLVIVDGVERPFNQLDPNEVASISVMKDASATAVYGVRGANGVIIVTTKRGSEGPARISVNMSSGVQTPSRLMDFTDSYTYAQMYTEAQRNDDPSILPIDIKFSDAAMEAFRTGSDPLIYPNTDWMDYIMKPSAMQQKGNVNISGGTKRVKYFVSMGYLKQDGLFRTFDSEYDYNFSYNRYNYRTNLDIELTKSTTMALTLGGRVGTKNEPSGASSSDFFRNISWSVPFSGPGIVDGKYILSGEEYIVDPKKDGLKEFYGQGYRNQTRNELNFDIDIKQKLDKLTTGLSLRMKYSMNSHYVHTKTRNSSPATYEPYFLSDVDSTAAPDDKTIVYKMTSSGKNLSYGESTGKGRNQYMEFGLDYKRRFGDHNVTGLLLYNQSRVYYPKKYAYIPTGLVGIAARATYNYKTRYLLDLNLGYNGSENFAEGQRFGFFPAGSVGWIMSEEGFMQNVPVLNYLKLRASYGLVGNDKQGDYRFLYLPDSYDPSTGGYNFGTDVPTSQTGAVENKIGNPGVTWETARKQNYGLDMKFFDNKLSVNYDWFYEHRNNILWTRKTVPSFVAYTMPAVNIGEVENQGFELEIGWRHQVNKKFNYWANVNMSHAENKILFKDEIPQNEDYLYETGYPVNQPFGYVFRGFYNPDADNSDLADHIYVLQPGDMTYEDLNADGVIDSDDRRAIGFAEYPQNSYGLNLGMKIGGFDIAMHWTAASSVSRMLDETYRVAFGQTLNRSLLQYMADERWTPETAETATFPRMTLTGSENNKKDSNFWLRDASYIRLKNIELGYDLRAEMLKKYGIRKFRIYANGYNLITIDKLEVADPEAKTGRYPKYPLMRVFNMGVKVNF